MNSQSSTPSSTGAFRMRRIFFLPRKFSIKIQKWPKNLKAQIGKPLANRGFIESAPAT
jgi:hypothetical protein